MLLILLNLLLIYPLTVDGSVSYSNIDEASYAGINGNVSQAPLFVRSPSPGPDGRWWSPWWSDDSDDDYGDLHLQGTSPCIDARTSEGTPVKDFEGNPRYDIPSVLNSGGGAYPYYDIDARMNT